MMICSLQMVIHCCYIGMKLKEISSATYLCLGIASISAMYICLAAKNNLIIGTLEHLQGMVDLRK